MHRKRGGPPEHIKSILTRVLSKLFLLDSLNPEVAPASMKGCPDHSSALHPIGGEDEGKTYGVHHPREAVIEFTEAGK